MFQPLPLGIVGIRLICPAEINLFFAAIGCPALYLFYRSERLECGNAGVKYDHLVWTELVFLWRGNGMLYERRVGGKAG